MLAAPRSGMDAPRRSAMQLSESLLLHWRHWMRNAFVFDSVFEKLKKWVGSMSSSSRS